jgi:tetratricopeptide (TPR) repeat protein/tRNA A-37 threonylcarbamoyl transferase component Bud32
LLNKGLDTDKTGRASLTSPVHPDLEAATTLELGENSAHDGIAVESDPKARYFGDYELIHELGRGGMGVVYKARQLSLNRMVALKLIKSDILAGEDERRRFQNEAETVALLDHPHIVPIYEVGSQDGRQYFTMKLINGPSLETKLVDLGADPKTSARLVKTVAEAVHHAHQRGILHRDLKPSNILLHDRSEPYVTDFGLAKRVAGGSEMTDSGAILGTPSYMAPEQAAGRRGSVTTTSDVHGLGAILYSLLTGRAPFQGESVMDILERVLERPPLPPSKINPGTPRDLEVICLKCLAKEPTRRYESAQALADDLGRYIEGDPIVGRPVSAWERAWKWARRRPSRAAALAALSVALITLLAGGLYYNARLRHEMKVTIQAERVAAANAKVANDQRNLALKVLNQLVYEVQEKLAPTPATRSVRQGLLAIAIAGLDEIGQSAVGAAPDLSQAVAHQKIGDIFRIIGRSDTAREHYERSRQLASSLETPARGETATAEVLYHTHMGLGQLAIRAQQFGAAKSDLARAVFMAESIVATRPGHAAARRDLIEAYHLLGRAYSFALEFPAAESWFRKMQEQAKRWIDEDPGSGQACDLLASSHRKLGDLRKLSANYAAARQEYQQAIDIAEKVLKRDPENLEYQMHLAIALDDLGGVAVSQRRSAEARQLLERAERLFSDLARNDPDNLETIHFLLNTQLHFARLDRAEHRFATAAERFRQVRSRLPALKRDGRLTGFYASFPSEGELTAEIDACDAVTRASGRR